jgi:hypothetical protein
MDRRELGNGFQLDQRPIIGFFAGRRQTDRNRNLAAPFLNTANRRGCALKNHTARALSTALIPPSSPGRAQREASEATPSFGRLCPAMTKIGRRAGLRG